MKSMTLARCRAGVAGHFAGNGLVHVQSACMGKHVPRAAVLVHKRSPCRVTSPCEVTSSPCNMCDQPSCLCAGPHDVDANTPPGAASCGTINALLAAHTA